MYLLCTCIIFTSAAALSGPYDIKAFLRAALTDMCDRIWENPPCSEFYEILASCIFDKLYPKANLPTSLRPIVRFALELEHFVCDHATPKINEEKLWSKGIAMYVCSVSVYYA